MITKNKSSLNRFETEFKHAEVIFYPYFIYFA